jgi:hypothetical protein
MKERILITLVLLGIVPIANNTFSQEITDLSVFLKPTKYINCDHQDIISKANELTKNCDSEIEKVKALFEYVRDSYTEDDVTSFQASEILKNGGNSCYKRSILLAALCRAIGIPSRLQYQSLLLKDFYFNGKKKDHLFTHAITGIYLQGKWYLYEPVGNNAKWQIWTEEKELKKDMTLQFKEYDNCLFSSTDKVVLKTIPVYFADYSENRYKTMMDFATGNIGIDYSIDE